MQHFAQFGQMPDGSTEKEGGGWARDAAIGGLEAGLGFAATDKLHHAIANNPKLAEGFLGSKAGKVAVGVGTGAIGTLAVGAGLNAIGGLLKKKPKPEADPNTQQQAQYSYHGNHFADFAPSPEQQELSQRNKSLMQSGNKDLINQSKQIQKDTFDANRDAAKAVGNNARVNPSQNASSALGALSEEQKQKAAEIAAQKAGQRAAGAEAKRVAGLGVVGKAKNYAGKGFKAIGGIGGLMTASYLAPSILGIFNSGQQQQNQNQEPPY